MNTTMKSKNQGGSPGLVLMVVFLSCSLILSYHVFGGLSINNIAMTDIPPATSLESSTKTQAEYPGESESVEKFHVDTTTGVYKQIGGGELWIKASDKFYDCAETIRSKYKATTTDKPSKHYKSQEEEEKFMYRNFFHNAPNRVHYFIELGALDGITFSNSYFFDFELGWAGLLIEGETSNYHKLEDARGTDPNKHVTTAHVAICTSNQFLRISGVGPVAAAGANGSPGGKRLTTVPCLPISDVIAMAKLPQVDFYSIDVEGAELSVIESHDFDAVPVHTILIEMRPADENLDYSNAKIRRALYARGFCRYDNSVGHNNEVWVNTTWTE